MAREDAPFLTLEDVKGFLASCEEEDEVGIPAQMHGCLAAETAKWKYGRDYTLSVPADNASFSLWKDGKRQDGYIDTDVTPYLDKFDNIFFASWYACEDEEQAVSKADLRRVPVFVELLAEEVQV